MSGLGDLLAGRTGVLRSGVVASSFGDGRYMLTDSLGRRYEVRSAEALALGAAVLHRDGVVIGAAGNARAAKTYEV